MRRSPSWSGGRTGSASRAEPRTAASSGSSPSPGRSPSHPSHSASPSPGTLQRGGGERGVRGQRSEGATKTTTRKQEGLNQGLPVFHRREDAQFADTVSGDASVAPSVTSQRGPRLLMQRRESLPGSASESLKSKSSSVKGFRQLWWSPKAWWRRVLVGTTPSARGQAHR